MMAAAVTVGTSELGQKKPFQNMTDEDKPTGGASGSPLRFLPGAVGVTPAIDAMMPKPPELPNPSPSSPADVASMVQESKASVGGKRARRNFTTVLTDPLSLGTSAFSAGKGTLLGSGFAKSTFGR